MPPSVVSKVSLSDLDLILQQQIATGAWQDLYMSGQTGSTVDHIYLPVLSGTGAYRLDVHGGNIADSTSGGEQYALAVSFTTVPEPRWEGVGLGVCLVLLLRRGKRPRGCGS